MKEFLLFEGTRGDPTNTVADYNRAQIQTLEELRDRLPQRITPSPTRHKRGERLKERRL